MTQVNFPNEGQTLKEEEISTYWEILRPHEPKGEILEDMENACTCAFMHTCLFV